ncbi:NUDIX hydrolase [Enterococcus timonensis]|uniref:NUDIX hydrolase n=1 Tax=Enterococcus timonensis TaxID=1852364 RepID=UPI0008DAA035|nr:NUDIX hydrolase [Enterococcus timonensis]
MTIPSFGEKTASVYQTRIGVYVVIYNEEKKEIILVQAPNGAYFLPGGEIEKGETQALALKRELLEELGFVVDNPAYLGVADEYFHSNHRKTDYYNPGYFYGSQVFQQVAEPLEQFNHVEWFDVETALKKLKRGSHRWAVEQFFKLEK